jgi:RimJ/RimL family protein N-acetyltransferase
MALVASILGHPAIWPHISDDGCDEPDPQDNDALYWMLASDDLGEAGVFLLHQHNAICWEVHTCLLPRVWGRPASQAAQLLLAYAFGTVGARKVITHVPAYNRLALRFAKAAGMTQEGVNRASFLKDGALLDQIMLGITEKEWPCH